MECKGKEPRGEKLFRCGSYLRISKEDGMEGESNSLQNQRKLIAHYVSEHPEFVLCGEWSDDGVSGSHFCRNGVQGLFRAVERGEIDCVLVKDFSRFGREYIETGYYLQDFFPRYHVRFIAICDGYDSGTSEFLEQGLLMPILTILNDSYCQDISKKVRLQQMVKRREGAYIGAFCVYGYKKDKYNPHHLIVDDEAAAVVRNIFVMRVQGNSPEKISIQLNKAHILSPYQYKKHSGSAYSTGLAVHEDSLWHPGAVRRILQNEMYTGVMLQGKRRKISYKLSLRENVPKEQWVRVEETHEPIISREVFVLANQPLRKRVAR